MNESSDNKTLSCVHFGSRCSDVAAVAAVVVVVFFLCEVRLKLGIIVE